MTMILDEWYYVVTSNEISSSLASSKIFVYHSRLHREEYSYLVLSQCYLPQSLLGKILV